MFCARLASWAPRTVHTPSGSTSANVAGSPAAIGGLPDQGRPIAVGEPATFALVDPDGVWTVRGAQLASRAANTPFEGMRLPATVVATMWGGRVTAREGKVVG